MLNYGFALCASFGAGQHGPFYYYCIIANIYIVNCFIRFTRAALFARCQNAFRANHRHPPLHRMHNGKREEKSIVLFHFILGRPNTTCVDSPFNTYTQKPGTGTRYWIYASNWAGDTHTHARPAMVVKLKLKNINGFHRPNTDLQRSAAATLWRGRQTRHTTKVDRDVNAQMFISKRERTVPLHRCIRTVHE